jgi:vacuolar-type H+-ATPase subunit E/Vma4
MIDVESNKIFRNIIISKDSKKEYDYQVFNDKDLVNDAIKSINYWIKKDEKTEIDNEIVISVTGGHVLEYDDPVYNVVLNSFENIIKILMEKINPILITSF